MNTPLARLFESARQQWPGIGICQADFVGHLTALGHEASLPAHPLELYLAFSTLYRDSQACAHFEREYMTRAGALVQGLVRDASVADDVLQRLREKLWLGSPPALAKYAGTSPLRAWLNTLAKHCAIDELRKMQRQGAAVIELEPEASGPAQSRGPESMLEGARERERFNSAVLRAIAQLSARDRNLLRLHYRKGVSAEALAKAYGVHRATVTRWLGRLRSTVFASAQSEMAQARRMSADEFAALAAHLHGQLDLAFTSWAATLE